MTLSELHAKVGRAKEQYNKAMMGIKKAQELSDKYRRTLNDALAALEIAELDARKERTWLDDYRCHNAKLLDEEPRKIPVVSFETSPTKVFIKLAA